MAKKADEKWWVAIQEGRTPDEWTDDMIRAGAARGIFRQCSIGWHFECSDWSGQHGCTCRCHALAERVISRAREKGTIQ
jgi:hypothetical protein